MGEKMEKVRLGRTNLMVTKPGFGGIPIQRLTEAQSVTLIQSCFELGVNFIDTANGYTTSEERIGKALKGYRDKIIVATKSGARTPEDMNKHLELSLKRLDTDFIDLYQFHGISDMASLEKIMAPGGALEAAEDARDEEKILHIGVTSHQIDVAKKAVATGRFETVMFPFNFITTEAADELIPLCRKMDVGFICMKPMCGGLVDNAKVAIKYLMQFPDIAPIPGIEKISEMQEIIKIMSGTGKMTIAETKEMQNIKATLGTHFCHRCDYCQPCTKGIPISGVLTHKSVYKRLPATRFFFPPMTDVIAKAETCSECGECEKRCPYHLPIREMIKEQVAWYKGVKAQYEKECAV
jgi:predicted aldo/keto reductase-like oxidoreductase